MKKSKMILSAVTVLAIVGSALAFKPFGRGEIYCNSACDDNQKIDWKIDNINGTITNPCENATSLEYFKNPSGICTPTATSDKFVPTAS
jgi:hypothetical protein